MPGQIAWIVRAAPLDGVLIALLQGLPGPWAGNLAAAVRDKVSGAEPGNYHLTFLCHLAAGRLDPGPSPVIARVRLDPSGAVDALVATLRFRHDMLKELQ